MPRVPVGVRHPPTAAAPLGGQPPAMPAHCSRCAQPHRRGPCLGGRTRKPDNLRCERRNGAPAAA
eukprot:11213557-Lingulodinium_polyedra.AAC.1